MSSPMYEYAKKANILNGISFSSNRIEFPKKQVHNQFKQQNDHL